MSDQSTDGLGDDFPSETGDPSGGASDAVSGAQDAPGAASGDRPEPGGEDLRQTAPLFLQELVVSGHMHWLQKVRGGGMQLKLVAATPMQQGAPRLHMPAYVFEFSAEGWEKFKRAVAADGEAPSVAIATHLPHPPVVPRG